MLHLYSELQNTFQCASCCMQYFIFYIILKSWVFCVILF